VVDDALRMDLPRLSLLVPPTVLLLHVGRDPGRLDALCFSGRCTISCLSWRSSCSSLTTRCIWRALLGSGGHKDYGSSNIQQVVQGKKQHTH